VRKLSEYLLANPIHAMAAALICAMLPLVSIPGGVIAAILVGFITLCRGYKIGLFVLFGVAIPAIVTAVWKQAFIVDLVLMRCVMVWLLASVLRVTVSWRLILEIMVILGILTVAGFHLLLENVPDWWAALFTRYEAFLNSLLAGQITEDKVHQMFVQITPLATGLFSALVLLGAFCQLIVARWWQAAMFRPGGLGKEFVEIRAGMILTVIFTLTVVAALLGVAFAIDLLPVVILPLTIGGLSLVHKWGRYNKKVVYLIAAIYVGLIFLPVVLIVVLALAGYVDGWYDLRKRYFSNHLSKKGV
jgi:hypothetical protein